MADLFPLKMDYLICTINESWYGVRGSDVVSVVNMPETTDVPNMPDEMRGVIDFQGTGIPLLDLRILFGETSRLQEIDALIQNMADRKQDHINWLNALKDEVMNDRPITVQTNPHKCKFGLWYDNFTTENVNLRQYMNRFDEPHKEIHHLAIEAQQLIDAGKADQAKALVERAESSVLARLLLLFDGIESLVKRYLMEYAVAFESNGRRFALAVDDINSFSRFKSIKHPLPTGVSAGSEGDIVQAIGRYLPEGKKEESDVMLLNIDKVVEQTEGVVGMEAAA